MSNASKHFFFFTDISETIGTGHFWRSARLAQAIGQNHPKARVTMMLPDDGTSRRCVERFSNAQLANSIQFLFHPDPVLTAHRVHYNPFQPLPFDFSDCFPLQRDLTLIDSYRFHGDALQRLKRQGLVGVVDDFGHIPDLNGSHVDFIINANHFGASYVGAAPLTVFDSPRYHFLAPRLFEPHDHQPNRLVITFGGTDKGHLGLRLFDSMWDNDSATMRQFDTQVVVLCPEEEQTYHTRHKELITNASLKIIRSYEPADLFGSAGKIICAGGQTVPEAQAAGTCFVGITSLNQTQRAVKKWAEAQGIVTTSLEALPPAYKEKRINLFAKSCLNVLRQDRSVLLPQQAPDGFVRLVHHLWAYALQPR